MPKHVQSILTCRTSSSFPACGQISAVLILCQIVMFEPFEHPADIFSLSVYCFLLNVERIWKDLEGFGRQCAIAAMCAFSGIRASAF